MHQCIWNAPLDGLMCPKQIINWHWTPIISSTLHGVNACFIHCPSNVENYSIGHKLKTGQPKKGVFEFIFFYTSKFLAQNLKYPSLQKFRNFSTFAQSALNGQYLNNKYALTLCESVKKVVFNFLWPIASPKCFGLGTELAKDIA